MCVGFFGCWCEVVVGGDFVFDDWCVDLGVGCCGLYIYDCF